MQIHVARHAAQLGIFSVEEITAGLAAGRFVASDLAWREGMASWIALGDWAEFKLATPPPSPGMGVVDGAPRASTIPWEQGKSFASFFATIKVAIIAPRETLAVGRYSFGDWIVFCYVAMALSLPFQLIGQLAAGDKNKEMAELIRSLHIPALNAAADQIANQPPTPPAFLVVAALVGVAIGPLMYALFGVIQWLGQRVFRYQVSIERTVSASLLAMAMIILTSAPFQLLGFSFTAQVLIGMLLFIPIGLLYYRALGAATGISAGKQFLISCMMSLLLCCCCCVLPAMIMGGVAGFAGLK